MTNVYSLPTQKRRVELASEWLAKLDRGLSAAEEQHLKAWLGRDAENRKTLLQLASLWDKMDSLSLLTELSPPASKRDRHGLIYPAIAASLAMLIIAGWLILEYSPHPMNRPAASRTAVNVTSAYETAIGERSTVRLPDQSMLTLNTNSLVRVTYNDAERLLKLERGEMNIEVAHDPTRPLSVIAGQKIVRAVGTAFNVQIIDDAQVELIVTEGTVMVVDDSAVKPAPSIGATPRTVTKGERVLLGVDRETVAQVSDLVLSAELSWRQGNLIFRGETLETAIAEVSRYTPVRFEIADDRLRQLRIGGLFKAGDVDGLLATLKTNFNIDSERLDAERVLLKAP